MTQNTVEEFRISPQQKRIFKLLESRQNDNPYFVQFSIGIEGALEIKTLKNSLIKLIKDHEILRTKFHSIPDMDLPVQVIEEIRETNETNILLIKEHHLSNFSNINEKIDEVFNQLLSDPLDLKQGPIIFCYILTLSANQHTLLFKLPSLLADSSTIQNFVDKLFQLYEAFFDHQALPEDSILQYADLAEWQNELLEDETAEYGRKYWQQQNVLTTADLQLPLEHPVQQSDFDPDWIQNEIPSNVASQLTQLATQIDASEDLILLACCYSLLWRLGIGDQITIGTELNGRKYEELNQTLGLLAKFVPIHGYCRDDQEIKNLLNDLVLSFNKAKEFQEYFSPDLLQEAFNQQQALFPICFSFLEQGQPIQTDYLSISIGKQYICTEPFKIKFQFIQKPDNLQFQIYYNRQFFTEETIQRIHLYYQSLLDSIIQFPESPISQLNILDSHERQQLLVNLNQTTTEYPNDALIHTLFEQQAKWNCDRIALCSEGDQFTYSEINSRANQLAYYLQTLITEPNPVVGLYFPRSAEWIIGMLAIFKAGGAYLPLDPSLPQESLAFRLKDAQASIILTQQHLLETLPETTASVVAFDSHWEQIAQMNTNNLNIELTPKHLAYVLFTSGSTGQPKGVAVEHRQLLNYYYAIGDQLDLSQCHHFANVSTFAADLGNTTIFPSLCRGGTLHIISQERATNPEAFVDYFQDHPIDCLKIVPSHLSALLTASQPEQVLPKQQLILGGEACHWHLIEQIEQYSPTCHIVNHYGPTETTIGALTYSIQPQSKARGTGTVPIGTPIANTEVYILDINLQPVPMDIPGEMYIGGAGVTRGYLNRPELTAERLIPNPFGSVGERLYKTGDLARYRSDGTIEFIGRADDQVKIHGFRIELGEIEATLNKYPDVSESIVLACADDLGKQRLIAYVVSEPDASAATEQLREFLQEKLPPYMIPSAFVWLKALPLNANGKVDRQALPDPETTRGDLEGTFVGPRTPTEQILADIWAQFLKRDRVDVRDNFFELGGDSILSMQIMAKAHQAGLQLTPQQIFEHQTIAELAEVAGGQSEQVQAEQGWVAGHVPLTPIQHWFFEQQLPEPHHWNQSVLLEVPQELDFGRFEQAWKYLLEHHDALRFRFEPTASGWQQTGTEPEGNVPFTELDLSHVSVAEQNSVLSTAAAQLQTSLNLSRGPVVRVAWFHLGPHQSSRLLVIIHHLAVDGVSWRILLEDLQTAYQQLSDGEPVQLPRKTTSFQQWAQRLQDYAGSETLRSEQDYWLTQLNQQIPNLPVDNPDGTNTVADARSISITFNSTETQALLQEVPSVYKTQINDVLLTALALAFQEWTGQWSLLLDLESHGREQIFDDIDLSRTVGWFTTIFPVLLQLKDTSNLGENLKAIKEQVRNIPNRGIGYGILRYLNQDTGISEKLQPLPKAQLRFNYLGQSDQIFQESSLFAPAQEASGLTRSPLGNRPYLIDINGIIAQGQLKLDWTYSQAIYHRATIEQFAQYYIEALRSLIAHCQSSEESEYTPSDFPQMNLNQEELNELLEEL